jgi:hypothetical protein
MTPQEKANELVHKMQLDWGCNCCHNDWVKECAGIAVEELIMAHNKMKDFLFDEIGYLITTPDYWQQVKKEIEKL